MKWKKYTIETTTAAEDFISSMLADLGIEGVEIEDNVPLTKADTAKMFIDFLPELPPDEGKSRVSFYLEECDSNQTVLSENLKQGCSVSSWKEKDEPEKSANQAEIASDTCANQMEKVSFNQACVAQTKGKRTESSDLLARVRAELEALRAFVDIGAGAITESETEDKDWQNNWKEFFHAFTIENAVADPKNGEMAYKDILIKPTWEELDPADEDKILIEIDPGISFGTGKHETTQLCIRQLIKYMRSGDEVLDLGCGSGILSIVSLKLGASHLVGTDVDEDCITSTYDNFAVNHLSKEQGDFYVGDLTSDAQLQEQIGSERYDIVVANILADVIIPMAPVIPARLKKGGIFISSGIIDFKENEVADAIRAAGLEILEINHQGEWVGITSKKL